MVIQFEVAGPIQLKPGYFKSLLGSERHGGLRRYSRVWWLWFSVSYWPGDLFELSEGIRVGEWKIK